MTTKIISFDISASPGVAVIEIITPKQGKPRPSLVMSDSIKTGTDSTDAQRFAYIEAFAIKAIHEYGPFDAVVREHFIKGGSKRGTQLVFGSWSKIDTALQMYGYVIKDEITPSQVKRVVGGKGGAGKEEVAEGVIRILGEEVRAHLYTEKGRLLDDRADAIAIGLTYAIEKGLIEA